MEEKNEFDIKYKNIVAACKTEPFEDGFLMKCELKVDGKVVKKWNLNVK